MSYSEQDIRTKQAYYDEWLLSEETQTQFLERKKLSPALFRTNGIKRGKPKVAELSWRSFLLVEVRAVEEKTEAQSVNLFLLPITPKISPACQIFISKIGYKGL